MGLTAAALAEDGGAQVPPVRMLGERLLVEPIYNQDINPDGVVYIGRPTTTFCQDADKTEQVCQGRVLAAGPGKRNPKTGRIRPMQVPVGSYIAFSDTCHRTIKVGETSYLWLRESDVIVVSEQPLEHLEVVYRR